MSWRPWKYTGYDYDPSINAYICQKTGVASTCKWMAKNKLHLKEQS